MLSFRRLITSVARIGKRLPQIKEKHTLPNLPYEYNALEPVICCEIMQLHHLKHHQGYVNALNAVEDQIKEASMRCDFATIISLSNNLKFNGGGHLNHSIFWENMSPNGGHPCGDLLTAICQRFGSIDEFKNQMSKMAVSVQGSGWAWLGFNSQTRLLELATCANQDPLQPTTGLIPLLGIDVWEHAYYIQYKNVRAEYVKQFWDIVNWNNVSERYLDAVKH